MFSNSAVPLKPIAWVVLFWTIFSSAEAALLDNPGFEDGTAAWALDPGSSVSTADVHEGINSLRGESAAAVIAAAQDLDVLPGLSIVVSGAIKAIDLPAGSKARIEVRHYSNAADYTAVLVGQQTGAVTAFRTYSSYHWVPLGTIRSEICLSLTAGGTAYFDGLQVLHATGAQLATNRGFENGTTGWNFPAQASIVTDVVHGQTSAAKLSVAPGYRFIGQSLPVSAGQRFTIKAWMSTEDLSAGTSGRISVRYYSSTGQYIGSNDVGAASGDTPYTLYLQSFTAPANTVRAELRLGLDGGTSGSAYFDDISLLDGDDFQLVGSVETLRAFPGAEGFGAETVGGRAADTQILRVTTLADGTGHGSLRKALSIISGPRIIVFAVAGTIELDTPILITNPYVTIAGQTSPGDGICLKGAGLYIKDHSVIVRGLRIRTGDDPNLGMPDGKDRDCITIEKGWTQKIIIDHCSLAWSVDELVHIVPNDPPPGPSNITFSYNILAEPLRSNLLRADGEQHAYACAIADSLRISLHHNLFAHAIKRLPEVMKRSSVEFINNIIYNCSKNASYFHGLGLNNAAFIEADIINNYYLRGPNTDTEGQPNPYLTTAAVCARSGNKSPGNASRFHIDGNVGPNLTTTADLNDYLEAADDDWLLTQSGDFFDNGDPDAIKNNFNHMPAAWKSTSRVLPAATFPVTVHPVSDPANPDVETTVLDLAGVFPRDAIDLRAHDTTVNGGGEIVWSVVEDSNDIYDWSSYSGTAPADTDKDGIPDDWEDRYGLNKNSAADAKQICADGDGGYLNIEVYINSLIAPVPR